MPNGQTHIQFISKPKPKTHKDYYNLPEYVEKRMIQRKIYKHIPTHICHCGVKTISMMNHLQSIRHVNAMIKLNPPEINL